LKGEVDVTDWRANDEIVFFAAVDYSDSKSTIGLRGAIDFYSRKLLWLNRLADKQRYYGGGSAEWVLPIDDQRVLFSTEFSHVFFLGPLDILDARSGKTRVSFEKGFQYLEDVALSWFTKEGKLYVFLQPKTGGIELQPYDLNTGRRLATKRIIGDQRVGNNPFPVAIAGHETLVLPYKPNDKSQPTTLVGFSLSEERVAWQMSMPGTERTYSRYIEQLVRNGREPNLLVAMTEPNGIMLLNGQVGSIVKQGQLEGYVGWDSRQAVLYAHPYLYAGARRKTSNGMAYDLVALNIESGAVEWSYEIDKQSEISVSPRAELQNLIAVNDRVYVLTVDGRIMAFRARPW
jgi:outer membrane protein assembly factor BamB